jgi:tetratricopeptide (TPR) repeat protein
MKGEEKLWLILNDKLDTLRASNSLPEAIRVAETALDLAKRTFTEEENSLALSYEKLGQLLDQYGDRTAAKVHLLKAHSTFEKAQPPDQRALFRSGRRLGFLCDNLRQPEEAIRFYEKAIAAGAELEELPYSDLGTMLNNVALIFRKSGRQKAAEPYYLHALGIYEKQLGPNHPDVASVLNNLAVFYTN